MALLGWEGFDNENLGGDLGTMPGWNGTVGGTVQALASPLGGRQFNFVTAIPVFTPTAGGTYTTGVIGVRIRAASSGTALNSFLSLYTSTGSQCGFGITTGPSVYAWTVGASVATAVSTWILAAATQYMFEAKITIGSSTGGGYLETHINGQPDIPPTTVNTNRVSSVASFSAVSLSTSLVAGAVFYDDFYLVSSSLPWPNDFLGNVHVDTVYPTGNSSVSWIPLFSSETNYQMIDETVNDLEATYNQSSSPTQIDRFTHGVINSSFGVPWDPITIYGVGNVASLRKNDLSVRRSMTTFQSSGTIVDGTITDLTIGSSQIYDYIRDNYVLDPTINAQWNTASVNQSIIGYKLSS